MSVVAGAAAVAPGVEVQQFRARVLDQRDGGGPGRIARQQAHVPRQIAAQLSLGEALLQPAGLAVGRRQRLVLGGHRAHARGERFRDGRGRGSGHEPAVDACRQAAGEQLVGGTASTSTPAPTSRSSYSVVAWSLRKCPDGDMSSRCLLGARNARSYEDMTRISHTIGSGTAALSLALAAGIALPASASAATSAAARRRPPLATTGEPVPAPPFTLPAGEVCPFAVHGEYPINEQRGYTYTEADGTVDELVVGRLVGVFTNVATGKTVRRDLSGNGFFRTSPDGTLLLAADGPALIGFHAGDHPQKQLEINGAQSPGGRPVRGERAAHPAPAARSVRRPLPDAALAGQQPAALGYSSSRSLLYITRSCQSPARYW